jgi:hypothetical protein
MKSLINIKRITKFSYIFGIACLLVGITFSFVPPPGEAATVNGLGNCSEGFISKDSSAPFKYTGDQNVCKVIVKAGSQNQPDQNACTGIKFPPASQTDDRGCYKVSGLGSSSVSVSKVGTDPSCKDISHVEFYPCSEPPATEPPATEPPATEPPVTEPPATEPPATEPPATEPPATEPPATELPATEPPATELPATEPPATEPPATEETPTDSPETVTPTDPPATVTPTDPPEKATPTEPVRTPTPPPTLSKPTPQKTDTPLILIPETGVDLSSSNQIFGSQFFFLLGMAFIGIGMIFQGFSKRQTRNESQE